MPYKNKADAVAYKKLWRAANPGRENNDRNRERSREWYYNNKEKAKKRIHAAEKERYQNDSDFRLEKNLRSRVRTAIKKGYKSARTLELVGASIPEVRLHIEKQFVEGMTWENYHYDVWHIDHIRPLSSFDLSDPEEQKKAFHYTNLQPLWAKDNLTKHAKY